MMSSVTDSLDSSVWVVAFVPRPPSIAAAISATALLSFPRSCSRRTCTVEGPPNRIGRWPHHFHENLSEFSNCADTSLYFGYWRRLWRLCGDPCRTVSAKQCAWVERHGIEAALPFVRMLHGYAVIRCIL